MFKVGDILKSNNDPGYYVRIVSLPVFAGLDVNVKCLAGNHVARGLEYGVAHATLTAHFVRVNQFSVGDKLRGIEHRAGKKATVLLVGFATDAAAQDYEVEDINHTFRFWCVGTGWELDTDSSAPAPIMSNGEAINNHTCPTCKNTRCNKQEKSCWRCGSKL